MKITEIQATVVNIPLEAPYVCGVGAPPGNTRTIIEVETDEGITGLGEAPLAQSAGIIEKDMAPRLTGQNPFDITACEALCLPYGIKHATHSSALDIATFGGIEMALWDIRGKAWDQPLYQLLGGAVRKEIPFTEYFGFRTAKNGRGGEMTAEAVVDYCLRMREEHGSTVFEGKLHLGAPELEIATVKLLREKLGEQAVIRLDANMAWSLPTAIRILREIEPCNIRNYEDPVATYEEMVELRRHTSIRFSTHRADLRRAAALGVPNAFVTTFAELGGINHAVKFIAACEGMGIDYWCYSGDAGICTAAYLHVVAATPWMREPSQTLGRWQTHDVIAGGPFRPENNVVRVPEGPGLGVTLDLDRLAYCHRLYVDQGHVNGLADPRFGGGWSRRLPLA